MKIPREIIEQRKQEFRIQPGQVPMNKGKRQTDYMTPEQIARTTATRFHKDQKIWNEAKNGDIRIRNGSANRKGAKPHKHIRISKAVWKELQIYNWEKKHGPVPKGYVLACKDGDTLNCKPSNWKLITMADNVRRNAGWRNMSDEYIASMLVRKKINCCTKPYCKTANY